MNPITYLDTLTGYTVITKPLPFHHAGLQETASGYGRRLRSPLCVRTDDGKVRRVYVTCFGNAGTAWVNYQGQSFVVVRHLEPGETVAKN